MFDNYFAKVKFSQIMKTDMLTAQDVFEYFENELRIKGLAVASIEDLERLEEDEFESKEEAYNQGWSDAIEAVEWSMPSKYR